MGVTKIKRNVLPLCVALIGVVIAAGPTLAQKSPAAKVPTISRANLAQTASFTVTSVLTPNGGSKVTNTFRVEVKGNKARLDYSDPAIGDVRYVANEKGVFFVIPANKTAVRQAIKGGVDQALQVAFAQANEQLKTAKKIGAANVNGQPTDIYKDAQSGTLLYVGTKPGFRLPVKTLLTNEGGSRSISVTNIKTNITLPDARFALPAGVQIIDSQQGGIPTPGRG
jgi:outer membrane lipoprotein-sorting protein